MNRKIEISILNVLFCLMVIFIHVTSYPITSLSSYSFAVRLLYPFQKICGVAVYGFIFLSGLKLFLNKNKEVNLKKYYFSRIKRVYIPYLVFVVLYYLYEVYRGYFVYSNKELFGFFLSGNVECHLYFVVTIMQFYILFPLWKWLLEKKHTVFILAISAVLNVVFVYYLPAFFEKIGINGFIYNDRVFTSYLFFWILGCFCGRNYEKFIELLKRRYLIFIIAFVLFLSMDIFLSYRAFTGQSFSGLTELVHLMYCAFSILFLYSLAYFSKAFKIFKFKILRAIDNASYEIYLVHILFIHIINDLIFKLSSVGILEAYVIRFLFAYILSIGACVLFKYIIKNLIKV